MHIVGFLQDLASIMIVAGVVTILFHQLKQPVVLGYIIAGVILGRHTPPFNLIQDENTVKTLAELGVIFLMFSLGLEFSIRKLFKVGTAAIIAALAEIFFMILVGYEIGQAFGWRQIDSIFLGCMLAISSTTIIIKALNDLGMRHKRFAHLTFGILIIEDILGIAILALLSGIAISGDVSTTDIFATLGKLLMFLVVSLVLGILIVPKLINYIMKFKSNEMLLITVLALCFGFCLLVIRINYSVALGAFVIGAIIAESSEIKLIEKLVSPITDMFSAIFFVSIGLLVDPNMMITYLVPIIVIVLAVIVGKILMCSLGVFLSGKNGQTSMRVGMSLAQIGEFSFIIATLGSTLKVTSSFIYPIIVAVSAITTLTTPYLIKNSDKFSAWLVKVMPDNVVNTFGLYTKWIANLAPQGGQAILLRSIKRNLLHIFINLMLVMAIFFGFSYFSHSPRYSTITVFKDNIQRTILWGGALILSLPFLIAIYRKLNNISVIIAEISTRTTHRKQAFPFNDAIKRIISELIPMVSMLGILLILAILSASILPPFELTFILILIALGLALFLWREFIKLYAKLQVAFLDSLGEEKAHEEESHKPKK